MAQFCHTCGTKNEDEAAFCENCGAPLRKRAATALNPTPAQPTTSRPRRKLVIGSAAAVGVVLALAGGTVWWLQPPAASAAVLGTALKASAPGVDTGERMVCISNGLPYGQSDINVGGMDQRTRQWMEALVEAGLYTDAGEVLSGGFFPQTLRRYESTAELSKWARNRRLCVAGGLEASKVTNIGEPVVQRPRGEEVRLVQATGVWALREGAPWLAKPKVLEAIRSELPRPNGGEWALDGERLVFRKPVVFAVVDRQWKTVNPADGNASMGRRADQNDQKRPQADKSAPTASLWDKFTGLFSFGGHPLRGRWQVDLTASGMGGILPAELAAQSVMVFTDNSCEVAGQRTACRFEVEGSLVKVTLEESSVELVFNIRPDGRAEMSFGAFKLVYKRAG